MKRKAVGFYWTLPVPWAGFRNVPANVDEAAGKSRTIRYQRQLIRRYAQGDGLDLIHETAFVEMEPDRGTPHMVAALDKAGAVCRAQDAMLLYVDFPKVGQWRSHNPMQGWLATSGIESLPIWPDPVDLDGKRFDPHAHFEHWRAQQQDWIETKPTRLAAARHRALMLRARGAKNPEIARRLNAEGLRSATGKPWTADSLRKVLAAES